MQYRLGTDIKVKDRGETLEIECPECKNLVKFRVFTNMDIRLDSHYPFFDSTRVYFLVCPKCASIYTVNELTGDEFKSGDKLSIGNYDLKLLKKFDK